MLAARGNDHPGTSRSASTALQRYAAAFAAACWKSGPKSKLVTGWTLGAGVEWRFAPAWSVKLEYLYVDLGNLNNTITFTTSSLSSTFNERDNIVRAGLNYKFW
jgi:opacity protein-like surface antigen